MTAADNIDEGEYPVFEEVTESYEVIWKIEKGVYKDRYIAYDF